MVQQVRQALCYLPDTLREVVEAMPMMEKSEEIRLRRGRRLSCLIAGVERTAPIVVTQTMLQECLDRATAQSSYAVQNMLRQGFLTLEGGHRMGVCGIGVYQNGGVQTLREISSLNLRIARQIRGAGDHAAEQIWLRPCSTLIIGAPGAGKTTLLRDLIRQMSDRFAFRIGVADERLELSGCVDGALQFDLGAQTDVLCGIRKETAVEMLLRSMNPEWIAVDEITAPNDVEAMLRASYCGVRFLATAHAGERAELYARPVYRTLMQSGLFGNLIIIGKHHSITTEVLSDA